MLHRFVVASAATIALTQIASAADIAGKAPPTVPPVYNWTGFYAGANVGAAWSSDHATLSFPDPTLSALDPITVNTGKVAVIGGIQEGVNWQFAPNWVWGIEADWSFTDAGKTISQGLTSGGVPVVPSSGSLSTKLDWLGSARNRLGYLITPNLMLYGTGGVAWGKVGYTGAVTINTPTVTYAANTAFSKTAVGWTAGAGLEWMITEHWLLRGEYLFYDLSSGQSVNSTNGITLTGIACILGRPCVIPSTATTNFSWASMSVNEVRMGLSYKF